MCKFFNVLPDDPMLDEINPVQKLWMYYNWLEDQSDKNELAKNHAYIIGSFINPEAVKKLVGDDKVASSSEDEFEESLNLVKKDAEKEKVSSKRRRKIK